MFNILLFLLLMPLSHNLVVLIITYLKIDLGTNQFRVCVIILNAIMLLLLSCIKDINTKMGVVGIIQIFLFGFVIYVFSKKIISYLKNKG